MLQHLLLMFAAPSMIVAGAPWQAFRGAVPVRLPLGFLLRPWVSVAVFNDVMIFWHLPGPYDTAVRSCAWLLHGSWWRPRAGSALCAARRWVVNLLLLWHQVR
jgi:cytochrome c oxidase assembly factor CtaG